MSTTMFIVLAFILILIYCKFLHEGFESRREKASGIYDWFKSGGKSYNSYKNEISQSDIVEYTSVKDLKKAGNLNVDNIAKVIS